MTTTDLKLEGPGSLPRPGPIGRLVRTAFGTLTLFAVWSLWTNYFPLTNAEQFDIQGPFVTLLLVGLFLVSYVLNIGFSRSWKRWPALVSGFGLATLALLDFASTGSIPGQIFSVGFFFWGLYVFGHLSICFFLAAILATPGCEMRSLHHLYSLLSGKPTKEHVCPVGPLRPIDEWEARRRQ